jgi:hypothetical protein
MNQTCRQTKREPSLARRTPSHCTTSENIVCCGRAPVSAMSSATPISKGWAYNTLSLSSFSKLSSSSPLASYCMSAIPSKELETIKSGGIGWLASAPESLAVGPLGGPIGCEVSNRQPGHARKHGQTLPSCKGAFVTLTSWYPSALVVIHGHISCAFGISLHDPPTFCLVQDDESGTTIT